MRSDLLIRRTLTRTLLTPSTIFEMTETNAIGLRRTIFISHKTAGSVHSTRRRATRGAGNRDASRPPPSNASHAATIARRDDQASPARVRTRGTHRRRVVALALGVFAEWKRAHGEEFPRGARADVRARLEARAARAVRGLPKHVRFPNAWKPTSAATTRRLAYAVGLDTRARRERARRRSSGKSTPHTARRCSIRPKSATPRSSGASRTHG